MPSDIRDYLAERFQSDADALRKRAASLKGQIKPVAGPNAALSLAMAAACDEVVTLAEALPEHAPLDEMLASLRALLPELNRRAAQPDFLNMPAVRSVYVGAATRVQEVIAVEERLMAGGSEAGEFDGAHDDSEDEDDE